MPKGKPSVTDVDVPGLEAVRAWDNQLSASFWSAERTVILSREHWREVVEALRGVKGSPVTLRRLTAICGQLSGSAASPQTPLPPEPAPANR